MSIAIANSKLVPLSGIGVIVTPFLSLFDVYYIFDFAMNHASIEKICDLGYNVYFTSSECFIQDRTSQKTIEISRRRSGLYVFNQFICFLLLE